MLCIPENVDSGDVAGGSFEPSIETKNHQTAYEAAGG
jgi:hypothetical protein